MNQPQPPSASAAHFSRTAAWLLWALLAGYFIFNKPFAQLGIPLGASLPPLYIGEIVLAIGAIATLPQFVSAYLQPVALSWTFRFLALFWVYGLLRIIPGFRAHGWIAVRDGACVYYAIAAFLAPALWAHLAQRNRAGAECVNPNDPFPLANDMVSHSAWMLLSVTVLGAAWAAALQFGVLEIPAGTKADFLTLSAAAAAWACLMHAIKHRPRTADRTLMEGHHMKFAALLFAALGSTLLATQLPTRAVWLSAPLLAAVALAAFASTRGRKLLLATAGVFGAALLAVVVGVVGASFQKIEREYALNENVDFSLSAIESNPGEVPLIQPAPPTGNSPEAKQPSQESPKNAGVTSERLHSLLNPDEAKFQTRQGQMAAHAVRWRAIFWLRCWHVTRFQSPLVGLGFGNNLTYLMRNTSAWPVFIESMTLVPPNRFPHSAHVHIFTRMGWIGLVLWLAILLAVLWYALAACWHQRRQADNASLFREQADAHRAIFFDGLALLGVWLIYLCAMSFGVVLEGPFGGIWFWALTGVLGWWGLRANEELHPPALPKVVQHI